MKRFLFVLVSILLVGSLSAQKLIIDKIDANGSRTMQTSYSKLYTKMMTGASVSLCCFVKESDTTFMLKLRLSEYGKSMALGRKLLIKLRDNTIITLDNVNDIGPYDYTRVGGELQTFPTYPITKEELLKIIDGDVIKIRIETDVDLIDRDIRGTMSDALREAYELICRKLAVKKSIYSDF